MYKNIHFEVFEIRLLIQSLIMVDYCKVSLLTNGDIFLHTHQTTERMVYFLFVIKKQLDSLIQIGNMLLYVLYIILQIFLS